MVLLAYGKAFVFRSHVYVIYFLCRSGGALNQYQLANQLGLALVLVRVFKYRHVRRRDQRRRVVAGISMKKWKKGHAPSE